MAKGFMHTGDTNVTAGEFPVLPDSTYTISGIDDFVHKDEGGNPYFKEYNGEMKVMFRFSLYGVADMQGPVMSCTAPEFIALVAAFGGDWGSYKVTRTNRMSSETLLRGKDAINKSTKRLVVETRKGWVNFIPEAVPPEGKYTVKFIGARRMDRAEGNLHFQPSAYGETLLLEYEIVGDGAGKPSIWDGFVIGQFLGNPFAIGEVLPGGTAISAREEGRPLWKRDERSGGVPYIVSDWVEFINYFAPEVLSHDWKTDPAESPYNVVEVEQPQYVILNAAKQAGHTAKVWYQKRKRSARRGFALRDLPMVNDPPDIDLDEEEVQPAALGDVIEFIETRWPETKIFEQSKNGDTDVTFTEEGREWAKEYLGGESGPWARAGLDLNDRRLHVLDDEQVSRLLNELKTQYTTLDDVADTPW